MSRHRFRSQPTLQRSGGGSSTFLVLGLIAGLGLGLGVLGSRVLRGPEPRPETPAWSTPIDQPATVAASEQPPTAASAPAPAPAPAAPPQTAALQAPAASPAAAPRAVKVKAHPQARIGKAVKASAVAPMKSADEQKQWAQQKADYDQAKQAYDAKERSEGYRWAQQNRVRAQRNCRIAAQRTPAFGEGCLSYVRTVQMRGGDKPAEPVDVQPSDQG